MRSRTVACGAGGSWLILALCLGCTNEIDVDDADDGTVPLGAQGTCGDGVCDAFAGEAGYWCGLDCCDQTTLCDQTYLDEGALYCREMWAHEPSGPIGDNYQWISASEIAGLCDEPGELCQSHAFCGTQYLYWGDLAKQAVCTDPGGQGARWTAWVLGTPEPACL